MFILYSAVLLMSVDKMQLKPFYPICGKKEPIARATAKYINEAVVEGLGNVNQCVTEN